jgi:hypothetical protein
VGEVTFQIDTGHAPLSDMFRIDRMDGLMQGVLDGLPDGATQAQIDDKVSQVILGELRKPKKPDTVRRALIRFWPAISELADRDPALFDQILLEFADVITTLR